MNEHESKQLVEVANDIKWLIKASESQTEWQGRIEGHLTLLNGSVQKNTAFRKIGTWLATILFVALLTLVWRLLGGG